MVIDPGDLYDLDSAGLWVGVERQWHEDGFQLACWRDCLVVLEQADERRQGVPDGLRSGQQSFAEGKVAMQYDGPWDVQGYNEVPGLSYGVVQAPVGPTGCKGAITGGFGLVIPKASPHAARPGSSSSG